MASLPSQALTTRSIAGRCRSSPESRPGGVPLGQPPSGGAGARGVPLRANRSSPTDLAAGVPLSQGLHEGGAVPSSLVLGLRPSREDSAVRRRLAPLVAAL